MINVHYYYYCLHPFIASRTSYCILGKLFFICLKRTTKCLPWTGTFKYYGWETSEYVAFSNRLGFRRRCTTRTCCLAGRGLKRCGTDLLQLTLQAFCRFPQSSWSTSITTVRIRWPCCSIGINTWTGHNHHYHWPHPLASLFTHTHTHTHIECVHTHICAHLKINWLKFASYIITMSNSKCLCHCKPSQGMACLIQQRPTVPRNVLALWGHVSQRVGLLLFPTLSAHLFNPAAPLEPMFSTINKLQRIQSATL